LLILFRGCNSNWLDRRTLCSAYCRAVARSWLGSLPGRPASEVDSPLCDDWHLVCGTPRFPVSLVRAVGGRLMVMVGGTACPEELLGQAGSMNGSMSTAFLLMFALQRAYSGLQVSQWVLCLYYFPTLDEEIVGGSGSA
jgi:hypothetical protein